MSNCNTCNRRKKIVVEFKNNNFSDTEIKTFNEYISKFDHVVMNFPNLKVVDTYDEDLGWFRSCPTLKSLVIQAPQLEYVCDNWLWNCMNLESFKLKAPKLEKVGRNWLRNCVELESIELNCPKLIEIGFDEDDSLYDKEDKDEPNGNFLHKCKKLRSIVMDCPNFNLRIL